MHGYGAFFVTGLIDRIYKADSTLEEGIEMMRKCVAKIQIRLVVSRPAFKVCIIDKNGCDLEDIIVDPANLGLIDQKTGGKPSNLQWFTEAQTEKFSVSNHFFFLYSAPIQDTDLIHFIWLCIQNRCPFCATVISANATIQPHPPRIPQQSPDNDTGSSKDLA